LAAASAFFLMPLQWTISQIGAREHYAVPRAFHQAGTLRLFYTDVWTHWGKPLLKSRSHTARALAGRFHPELPSNRVVSFTARSAWQSLLHGRRNPGDPESAYREYVRAGASFGQSVANHLKRQPLDPARDAFFGFFTGCLETLEMLRPRGLVTVVDQADAGRVHYELIHDEAKRWPGWQEMPPLVPDFYFDRLAAEWNAATLVLVNSPWSQAALVKQGVPESKIIVVPLAYEPKVEGVHRENPPGAPLTVLWVGNVGLTKGIQYLIEAAKQLRDTNIRFVIAGAVGISRDALATAPPSMTFLGSVTRNRVGELYREADVFVLPTLSDGFGLTQLEAMSYGLPVVATPNCGRVVTPEVNGLIVPAYDASALARAFVRLNDDRALLGEMSRAALIRSREFSLSAYADRLQQQAERAVSPAR